MSSFGRNLWVWVATLFYVGLSPIAPGTLGSLATVVPLYFIKAFAVSPVYFQVLAVVVVFVLGLPASRAAIVHFKKDDPGQCIIDEVAGQMVALIAIPHNIYYYIAAFALFRLFDILKPFPVNRAERIKGPWGIMLDDIVAGLMALALLHLYRYFF